MRAVVTGCGLASEDVLPARNGVGNRPKKPSLLLFFITLSTHPMPLRDSTHLGHLGKALVQAKPQELGTFSTLGVQRP